MQAPDATVSRGPITLSIRKRSGRTISAIVERGISLQSSMHQRTLCCISSFYTGLTRFSQMCLSAQAWSRQRYWHVPWPREKQSMFSRLVLPCFHCKITFSLLPIFWCVKTKNGTKMKKYDERISIGRIACFLSSKLLNIYTKHECAKCNCRIELSGANQYQTEQVVACWALPRSSSSSESTVREGGSEVMTSAQITPE